MISKKLSGGTDYLNRLTLPEGQLAVDTERRALRVYDGALQGGYEVLGVRPPINTPGPKTLIAGDLETGFYGEVGPADFISYGELSSLVGLSAGTLHNDASSLWLKFSMDNHPCYVAKRTVRHSISHDHLAGANLVYGDKSIEIGEFTYVIRLLTGLVNPNTSTAGGEWNRLMYPIYVDDPNQQGWGVNYNNSDLILVISDGCRSWVQEARPSDPAFHVFRGYSSVEYMSSIRSTSSDSFTGWRPILIPIS